MISRGLVSEVEIGRALTVQKSVGGHLKLGSILMIGGVLSEHRLLRVLMDLHGVPAVSWRSLSEASEETAHLLPTADAIRWGAVAYAAHQQVIGVAFSKPSSAAIAEIGALTGMKVFPGVAPEVRIFQAQQRFYGVTIEEPIRRLLAVSDGSTATRLALEELLLLTKEAAEAPHRAPASLAGKSLQAPPAVLRETADEAAPRKKTLRDQVVEALAEFDDRSRAIFAAAEARETPPDAAVEVVGTPPPAAESQAGEPLKAHRKTGFTTDDLRALLFASSTPAPSRPAPRRKAVSTPADLRELMRG